MSSAVDEDHQRAEDRGDADYGTGSQVQPSPTVEGFEVGRLLGQGGSALVWLVTDDAGRRFALKVARAAWPGSSSPSEGNVPTGARTQGRRAAPASIVPAAATRGRFDGTGERRAAGLEAGPETGPEAGGDGHSSKEAIERELRLLQRFTHEHLVRVHRMVTTDQGPGMVMDLAAGGSLLGLVTSRGPLPVSEVVTALVPVAQVLSHLHAAGALHGDVTPGNILFTHEGKPLLGDFGTGRLLGADPGVSGGTPGFVDPTRRSSFDAGSDIFALAAVSWFALTGRIPGPNEQRPPLVLIVPDVPPVLMQLIEDGLSSSRERRPTADNFARTLLGSSSADPVNLVSAVHASVRPELLTRRTGSVSQPPLQAWKRLIAACSGTRHRAPAGGGRVGAREERRSSRHAFSRQTPSATRSTVRGGTNGRRWRAVLAAAAGTAAVVLLVAGIVLTAGGPPGAGSSSAGQTSRGGGGEDAPGGSFRPERATPKEELPNEDPAAALGGLAERRAEAFATGDPALLAAVDVEGSPAMSADRNAVAALADSGTTLEHLTITIRNPSVLTEAELVSMPALRELPSVDRPPAATEVSVVRATAELSSYTETPASPRASSAPKGTPSPLMAAGQQELIFVLWDSGNGWQIHSVVSPPA